MCRCELPLRLEVVDDGATPAAAALQAAVSGLVQQLETPGISYLASNRCARYSYVVICWLRFLLHAHKQPSLRLQSAQTFFAFSLSRRSSGAGSKQLLQPSSEGLVDLLPGSTSTGAVTGAGFINCTPVLSTAALAAPPAGPAFAYRPLGASSAGAAAAASTSAPLRLDVLVYVRRGSRVSAAVAAVTRALVGQLQAAQRVLGRQQAKVLPVSWV